MILSGFNDSHKHGYVFYLVSDFGWILLQAHGGGCPRSQSSLEVPGHSHVDVGTRSKRVVGAGL
jgi:hypothetical protein